MDIFEFEGKVKAYANEEEKTAKEYIKLAEYAKTIGLAYHIVDRITNIALDEDTHYRYFEELHAQLTVSPEHLKGEPSRLFPQTYGDWVSLAGDIKQQRPDISFEVNTRLGHIASEMPEAEGSKRWLTEKAEELGIT